MTSVSGSIPLRLAQQYAGVSGVSRPGGAAPTGGTLVVRAIDTPRPAPTDSLSLSPAAQAAQRSAKAAALVGAKLPASASPIAGTSAAQQAGPTRNTPATARATDALPFYRSPTDTNTAATAISLGRSLDVTG